MPLWEELVRSGETAYAAARRYGCESDGPAGWCFDRFGMTRTRLPDGRIVCVAGEHEDYYDPDFFIYNDVIVIHPDGEIKIYGYSLDAFAPTDFHTATLVGDAIYIIGRMGYRGERGGTSTPIYRLDMRSMHIHAVVANGQSPGWISDHRAELAPDGHTIYIAGGQKIVRDDAGKEVFQKNAVLFSYDTALDRWSPIDGVAPKPTTLPQAIPMPDWKLLENEMKARQLRDSIVLAVAPDHPLFCGEFLPIAKKNDWTNRVALQMLDGSGRWAICDGPDHTGREEPPLIVTFYSSFDHLAEAAGQTDDNPG